MILSGTEQDTGLCYQPPANKRGEKGRKIMAIILAIIYFILAGICWKNWKIEYEDNCLFGFLVFMAVGIGLIIYHVLG